MTFPGDFCLGREYRDAHLARIEQELSVTEKMLEWMNKPNNIFYFCGNVGNGKTYFAAAWYNLLKEKSKTVRIFTEQSFFSHLLTIMNLNKDPHAELERLCEVENFILDDMGSSKPSEWKDEMLLSFVNHRSANNLPTLITSNLNRDALAKAYHPRFVSRIYASKNTIIELNGPDRRQII